MQPGRQGVDGQIGVKIQPILEEHLKQPSLGGWLKKNFLVDEIPHFLNKSTDGRSSVTVVGAMPSFGWVGSFLLVGEPHFLVIITIHYLSILVGSPPGIVSLLPAFVAWSLRPFLI